MIEKGINWKVGKVFHGNHLAYEFDLLPEEHHKIPAMINLQQYYLEEYLVRKCIENPRIELRWKHKAISLRQKGDTVTLEVETPDGSFELQADWLIACDGASSDIRSMVGADFTGKFFQDRFLIADVVMKSDFPTERWFWFDPPFHRDQSTLLHKQADDVWRIDFQLGWDADPEEASTPENIIPLLTQMLGEDAEFELEWVSVYQFACRRMASFRHGRVIFAGDSAHQVSPFGARGANSGVQDIDNLAWKLELVLSGKAPQALLDSYSEEREYAADDNIRVSTRSTDFMTPKSKASRAFRDSVLELSRNHAFARPLVNSGRLSTPTPYLSSSLNTMTPDEQSFQGEMKPGTNCADAPIHIDGTPSWFLNQVGDRFTVLIFGSTGRDKVSQIGNIPVKTLVSGDYFEYREGLLQERYDAREGTVYLLRPDQHVAARWRKFDGAKIQAAINKATCSTI
jgi:3-(3-hydroxy-phenyl)propionate hydroxylase